MKKFYIAVTIEQDKNEVIFTDRTETEYKPGYYAYAIPCTEADNLRSVLARVGGLVHANLCPTKKRAAELVTFWNDGYKANGTYLFSDGPLF